MEEVGKRWSQLSVDAQVERAKREGWEYDGTMASEQEALDFITGLVRAVRPEVVVETGTYSGLGTNAITLALAANRRGHVHTVEHDAGLVEKLRQANRGRERVTFHYGDSAEWCRDHAPLRIDVAFVDSGDPDQRLRDVKAIWPKLRDGGYLLVHDTTFHPGLYEMVSEIAGQGIRIETLNGLGLWRKTPIPQLFPTT